VVCAVCVRIEYTSVLRRATAVNNAGNLKRYYSQLMAPNLSRDILKPSRDETFGMNGIKTRSLFAHQVSVVTRRDDDDDYMVYDLIRLG